MDTDQLDPGLTTDEQRAIAILQRLARRWPKTLWLYSASGEDDVMKPKLKVVIKTKTSYCEVNLRFIAVAGRTRTRWLREANRRIIAAGGQPLNRASNCGKCLHKAGSNDP